MIRLHLIELTDRHLDHRRQVAQQVLVTEQQVEHRHIDHVMILMIHITSMIAVRHMTRRELTHYYRRELV